jgi:hypothetical protein
MDWMSAGSNETKAGKRQQKLEEVIAGGNSRSWCCDESWNR